VVEEASEEEVPERLIVVAAFELGEGTVERWKDESLYSHFDDEPEATSIGLYRLHSPLRER
jgi:hypothetical protein